MRRAFILIFSLAFILSLSLFLVFYHKKEKSHEITLYGNVDVRQVDIGFRVAGRIAALHFEEGDFVAQGTLMAELEPSPYDSQVAQARANLSAIEAKLENASLRFDRRGVAVNFGGVSKEDFDNSQASKDELFSQLKAAQAALKVSIDNLEYTKVFCPTNGIILSRVREPGSVVNPTDPVYILSVSSPVWVRAFVNEPELGLISYGMAAEVTTDSGSTYKGKIGFISPVAEFTPKTVETAKLRTDLVYRLRIYVDNPDHFLKQGMPVTVKLQREP